MLSLIRALVRNPIFGGFIVVMLIAAFALFGVENIFRGGGTSAIIVGSEQISVAEVQREYDLELRSEQERNPSIAAQLANDPAIGERVVQRLTQIAGFSAKVNELQLGVSDEQLANALQDEVAFQNPLTGQFDRITYLNVVRQQGYVRGNIERQFEADYAKGLARGQYIDAAIGGIELPDVMAVAGSAYINEQRSLQALFLPPSLAGDIADPTDEELNAFILANASRFQKPERRAFTLVRLSPQMITSDIEVDEQALQELFEFRLEQGALTEPATRSLSQWPAADADSAQAAADSLNAGADIDTAVAEFALGTRVDLENLQGFEIPDSAIADAAFELGAGEFQAVEARLGWFVVGVTGAFDPVTPTLETARPELAAELTANEAQGRVLDAVNALVEAQSAGATLEEAARNAGIPAETFDFTGTQGENSEFIIASTFLNRDPRATTRLTPEATSILETVFSLPVGFESDVLNLGEDGYFIVRVDGIDETRLFELSEIRDDIEAAWRLAEVETQLSVLAQAAQARAEAGEDLNAIAADFDGARVELTVRTRSDLFDPAQQIDRTDPFIPQLLNAGFQIPQNGVFLSAAGADERSVAVVRVIDVIAPETAIIDPNLQTGLSAQLQNDLFLALAPMLVNEEEVSVDQRLLDLALRRVAPEDFQ